MRVWQLYQDCILGGGKLLVQPEHILSFKLMDLEWLYNSKHPKGDSRTSTDYKKVDKEVTQLLLYTQK